MGTGFLIEAPKPDAFTSIRYFPGRAKRLGRRTSECSGIAVAEQ